MYRETIDQQMIQRFQKQVPELPITRLDLQLVLKKLQNREQTLIASKTRQKIQQFNIQAIQKKFTQMMQKVFQAIEPELKHYRKNNSINYLDPIICKNLDPKIYHKGYQLHKHKTTPMAQLLNDRQVDIANKLFTQVFDVMNELLITMRIYYGYQKEEQISEALYQSISVFTQQNQGCIFAQEDRRSYIEQQEQKKDKKEDQTAPYDVLLDVLEAISQDKVNLSNKSTVGLFNKAQNLISVIYKYAIAPTVEYTYQKIKNINPLATNKNLTAQQQLNLRMSLMENLRPNLSVRDPIDQKMVTFLIKMVPMKLQQMATLMSSDEKEQFLQIVTEVLNDFQNPNGSFEKIVKQLMKLLQIVSIAEQDQKSDHFSQFKQSKWVFLFYKAFEENYSPERRRVLFKVCHLKKIKSKLSNPIGILKLIQSQNIAQNQLLQSLRKLHVTQKSDDKKKIELEEKKDNEIHLKVDHQLNRIHLFQLKNKHDKIPLILFDRLTSCPPKRVISILFSGFMSEDTCKVEQWGGLLDTIYDSQIYSIRWESKSYGSVFDFAVETAKDIAAANLKVGILGSLGGPYLRAIAIIRQIYKKYHSNPFNPAFKSAKKTGEYLAELVMKNFKGHFINLIGYSLGTELIKNMLLKMAEKQCLGMINKVYFMGGLSDITQIEQIIKKSPVPLTIINLYSKNDNVLRYLLKLCKPSLQPIGLGEIPEVPGHNIRNRDTSVIIKGHLQYRDYMNLIAKLLNMKDD